VYLELQVSKITRVSIIFNEKCWFMPESQSR